MTHILHDEDRPARRPPAPRLRSRPALFRRRKYPPHTHTGFTSCPQGGGDGARRIGVSFALTTTNPRPFINPWPWSTRRSPWHRPRGTRFDSRPLARAAIAAQQHCGATSLAVHPLRQRICCCLISLLPFTQTQGGPDNALSIRNANAANGDGQMSVAG